MANPALQVIFGQIPIGELTHVLSAAQKQRQKNAIILLAVGLIGVSLLYYRLHKENKQLREKLRIIKPARVVVRT
jgi:hypothetical protein